MFKHIAIVSVLLLGCASGAIAQSPTQFTGDGLTVQLGMQGDTYVGTVSLAGTSYPLSAISRDGQLVGNFEASGTRYNFTMATKDNGRTFTFETGGSVYRLTPGAGGAPQPGGRGPGPNRPLTKVDLTYLPTQLVDPKTRLAVGTFLAPKGWQIDPGILWRPMDAQFVAMGTSVFDPNSGWAARWIPHDQFSCNPMLYDNAINQGAPPRSIGGIEYTKTLPNAVQYIQGIVLPRYRNIQGLKVIAGEELPRVAQAIDQSQPYTRWLYQQGARDLAYSAGRLRVEYTGPGNVAMEEEIICVLNVSWSPQGLANAKAVGVPGDYFFMPDRLYSYTAPKGQLDAAMPYMETIILSMRPDQTWMKFVDNIQGSVTAIVMDQYKIEEAARRAITDSQRKTVEESWKSADRQSREVGALLSGTQARQSPFNPNGPPMNAPAGKVSWTNPRGEWRHLEPGDDPNTHAGSSKDWQIAKNSAS